MKCKLCGVAVINGVIYRNNNGCICLRCKEELEGIVIKGGEFLIEESFLDDIYLKKTII